MFNKKNLLRLIVNSAIGIILIIIWLKLIDLDTVLEEISKVKLIEVLPFVLFFASANFFRSLRLKILLRKHKIGLKNVILVTFLGQLLSFTIPLRIGEVTKGIYLSSQYGLNTPQTIIWIFLDRFIDFWLILVLALILLILIPTNLPGNILPGLTFSLGVFSLGACLVIFLPSIAKKLVNLITHFLVVDFLKKYFSKVSHFLVDTASFLKLGFKNTSLVLGVSLLALLCDGLSWYVVFRAVFSQIDFLQILTGSLFSSLTYLIPSAPGYVGSAEASGLAVFSLGLGLNKNLTSVVVVVVHGLTLLTILLFGLTSLYFLKFDLGLVWRKLWINSNHSIK